MSESCRTYLIHACQLQPSLVPDVCIFVLVPHVLVLLLPVHQQSLHLVHNAGNTIGDLHNAAQGGILISRDDVEEGWSSTWLRLTIRLDSIDSVTSTFVISPLYWAGKSSDETSPLAKVSSSPLLWILTCGQCNSHYVTTFNQLCYLA